MRNATSATTPMPMRAHVGRPEGVTKASIAPETARTKISPRAMTTVERPSSARASARLRGPGSTIVQSEPQPGAGRHEHRGQPEDAVRRDQPEEDAAKPGGEHVAADDSDVDGVLQQRVDREHAEQQSADEHLRRDPDVVGPHLRGEVVRGMCAVVVGEVVVDELPHLARRQQRPLHVRMASTQIPRPSDTASDANAVGTHQRRLR